MVTIPIDDDPVQIFVELTGERTAPIWDDSGIWDDTGTWEDT